VIAEVTGPPAAIAECPDLGVLELAPLAPEVHAHVDVCDACQLVLELLGASDATTGCGAFEGLLAARADGPLSRAAGELLDRHLAGCTSCRLVAETLAPSADAAGDHESLPRVDPASYALGLEVARGGMGRILAARDLRVGRPVAVKELLGRSRQLAARFEREARVTARLQHPGIVPIYEIGRWPDGTPFYAMRMVDGGTLRDTINHAGTLAARLALLPAVIAATEAVAFAHGQRVIHRDLTPSNVLVGQYGETVVIDWGLAKDLADTSAEEPETGASGSGELTSAGAVIGTAAYMPPEQAHARPVDERADVYALGAILYHLLAGQPPYRGQQDLLAAVKAGPPRPVEALEPAAPRDLLSIVVKAMARDPAARYPSARELADELKRFQTGRMVEAHEYTTFERMRRFVRRNRAPLTVTAIAACALAGVGVTLLGRVYRERSAARTTVLTLLEEEGRVEALAGNSPRALAYLDAARAGRRPGRPLAFLLAAALRDVSTVEADLDCGSDIRAIRFTKDRVIAACHDVARIWRLDDRTLVATLGPFPAGFDELAFSHDGTLLVTMGGDGVARLWDAETGAKRLEVVHGAGTTITFTTFTPDDAKFATSGYDGWARIWDTRTGALVRAIHASDAPIFHHLYGLLSADGKHLLAATIEGIGGGWDIETGEKIGTIRHGSFVGGGTLSPDGKLAATCGMDHLIKVWDTSDGHLVQQLAGGANVMWHAAFSEDSTLLVGNGHDGHAFVWDLRTGAAICDVDHGEPVWTAHFSPDASRFVTVGITGSVKVWDTRTGGLLAMHETQGGKEAVFSPDGTRLLAARGDGRIRIWRGPDGPLRAALGWSDREALAAASPDGERAAVQRADGWVTLRDTATRRELGTERLVHPIAASATRFAGVGPDGAVRVIAARDGSLETTLPVVQPDDLALAGDRLVASFRDHVEVWDIPRRAQLASIAQAHHALPDADGTRVLVWGDALPLQIREVGEPGSVVTLHPHDGFHVVGFARSDTRVVLDERATITVWNADDGSLAGALEHVSSPATIDATGTRVTTVVDERSVDVWNLATGSHHGFVTEPLQRAEVDPHGELVAAVAEQGDAVLVLDARQGQLLARWPIAHAAPALSEAGFRAPSATASWSLDGATIVARSAQLSVWNASTELPPDLSRLVARNVPWIVDGGRLVPARARLTGHVVRAGEPVPGCTVKLEYRRPPGLGGDVSWEHKQSTQEKLPPLVADETGTFETGELAPGYYTVTVDDNPAIELYLSVEDQEQTVDLARQPPPSR
jgi:WD40 repeat protein